MAARSQIRADETCYKPESEKYLWHRRAENGEFMQPCQLEIGLTCFLLVPIDWLPAAQQIRTAIELVQLVPLCADSNFAY